MTTKPPFRKLEVRAFVHATEDQDKVVAALRFAAGDLHAEATTTEGYHGNPITILSATVPKAAQVHALFTRLAEAGIVPRLLDELEERMDEQGNLHLHLDKQEAYRGRLALAGEGDVIALRGKAMAYPATRERMLDAIRLFLEGFRRGTEN